MRPQTVSVKPTEGATRGGTVPEEAAGSSATFLARTGFEPETRGS